MGARATNSHKLEMLDRSINTMFPVACDRPILEGEKASNGREREEEEDRLKSREGGGAWRLAGEDENYWSNTEKARTRDACIN